MVFQNFWKQVKQYLFPVYCLRCRKEGDWLCEQCESLRPPVPIQRCVFCRAVARFGETCAPCRRRHHLDGLVVRGVYGSWVWRDLIHAWKYQGAEELGGKFGGYLKELLEIWPIKEEDYVVIPVPLAHRRERDRGFNQSVILAKTIAEYYKFPISNILARTRETLPQSKLTPADRLNNVNDCFVCVYADVVRARDCLLVDDIATTGATLDSAARVLQEAGASSVWALALVRSDLSV